LLHAVLKRYKQPWGMQLELKPMFLGGVMQAAGNKPYAVCMSAELSGSIACAAFSGLTRVGHEGPWRDYIVMERHFRHLAAE
jgi:2-hydroxychromene-2-carboxylate isomerase